MHGPGPGEGSWDPPALGHSPFSCAPPCASCFRGSAVKKTLQGCSTTPRGMRAGALGTELCSPSALPAALLSAPSVSAPLSKGRNFTQITLFSACAKRAARPQHRGTAAEPTQRLHRRWPEGEERRGAALALLRLPKPCAGGAICRFSPHLTPVGSQRGARGCPWAVPSPVLPRGSCGVGAGCAWHGGCALPLLVFSPPQQHWEGCWGGAVMYLLTCYILAKTKQNVLTEKKKVYIFQVLKRLLRGRKISCVRHFCKCHLQLFFFPLVDISSWAKQDTPLSPL